MALIGDRTYVGFGFGAIQSGLFLYEAFQSDAFHRLVVAEIVPDAVAALRRAGGDFTVNIAHPDRVEHARIGPIAIEDPAQEEDRQRLIDAVAAAAEIGTAVPSVEHYVSASPASLHRILAQGLRKKLAAGGPRAVIYAAENHNRAAEILKAKVFEDIPQAEWGGVERQVQFLNTVIGKMSGVVTDPLEIRSGNLTPITPDNSRAFLVEAFNRILISSLRFAAPFERGIQVFEEKPDLLPFEEAKLYGHNATHALAAYVGAVRGIQRIAEAPQIPGMMAFLRAAFIDESGEALIRKYRGLDPLFTPEGYRQYADDLLRRMTNPYLRDTVERVGRDSLRKLGWDDRLIGTMRLAQRHGIEPRRYAFGAASALAAMTERAALDEGVPVAALLSEAWCDAKPEEREREMVIQRIVEARRRLRRWIEADYPDLEQFK